jgi:hypothetical protein
MFGTRRHQLFQLVALAGDSDGLAALDACRLGCGETSATGCCGNQNEIPYLNVSEFDDHSVSCQILQPHSRCFGSGQPSWILCDGSQRDYYLLTCGAVLVRLEGRNYGYPFSSPLLIDFRSNFLYDTRCFEPEPCGQFCFLEKMAVRKH